VYLIAGLGNPGRKYQFTRHNLGFRVVEALAQKHHLPLNQKKFQSIFGQGIIEGQKVHLLLPQTYMNLSGVAVGHWIRYFHGSPERVLAIHDDLDLAWGRLRIVARGGAAGHRGVLSLIEHLHTNQFVRLRVGVGRPPDDQPPEVYVLEPLPASRRDALEALLEEAGLAVETILRDGLEQAMNIFNARKSKKDSPRLLSL
jgi:peptidyl-tRNA hydrolase, PTH1 family